MADAFMLVTSYDSPLAEEELRILRGVSSSPGRVFLIVNKHDIVSASERAQVLSHVREQASRAFADSALRIFSVSAREAIDATKMNDSERFNRSGVAALEEELIRYLLEEKQSAFLMRMSERIFEALSRVPDAAEEIGLLQSFTSKRIHSKPTEANRSFAIGPPATPEGERFDACPICEFIEQGMYEFLCTYQYAVATDRSTQTQLAERGGLCAFHIWHYASVSSPHGTCVGFAGLFEYLAKCLREISTRSRTEIEAHAVRSLRPTTATCSLCLKQSELEAGAVARTAQIIQQERARKKRLSVAVCLPHLELVAAALGDDSAAGELLRKEADVSERMAEDMRRYALKQEGLRQYLASDEELHANYRALVLLGGHRNVHGLRKRT